jgi:Rrf2 family protein
MISARCQKDTGKKMIFSRSSEYALRAFACLAEVEPGTYVMAKDIAQKAELPGHFLAKILQQLARKGYLKSNKGPSGGFTLAQPASKLTLMDIVTAVDGTAELDRFPFKNGGGRSAAHNGWKVLRSSIVDYLESTSVADLAGNPADKKARARKIGSKA